MKQYFSIPLLLAGLLSTPLFAEATLSVCGDWISADGDQEPDEDEEEPDCD